MSEETNVMKVDSEKRSSRCISEISENGKEQRKRTYSRDTYTYSWCGRDDSFNIWKINIIYKTKIKNKLNIHSLQRITRVNKLIYISFIFL